jgi:endonuclease YncB( thermonuclease family)
MSWRSVRIEWFTVLLLLAVLVAIQYFRPEWTGITVDRSAPNSRYQAIDGDSFKAGSTEIRLYGIDAPEYRQSCTDQSGQHHACGKLARDVLSNLIRARTVSCKIIDRDRYGREVSVCKDGALDINREMVRMGWAVAYRKHAVAYVAAENEAKKAKRGIWAWAFIMPEEYRVRNRKLEGSLLSE